jgi:hypothetical protein
MILERRLQEEPGLPGRGWFQLPCSGTFARAAAGRPTGTVGRNGDVRFASLTGQPRPNQKFAHHCNTAGHKEKLRMAKDILGNHPWTSELRDLLEEIPRRISGA